MLALVSVLVRLSFGGGGGFDVGFVFGAVVVVAFDSVFLARFCSAFFFYEFRS